MSFLKRSSCLLSFISETTVATDEITCFCYKTPADFATNNGIRKSFLLQATFTRDVVAIFPKNYLFFLIYIITINIAIKINRVNHLLYSISPDCRNKTLYFQTSAVFNAMDQGTQEQTILRLFTRPVVITSIVVCLITYITFKLLQLHWYVQKLLRIFGNVPGPPRHWLYGNMHLVCIFGLRHQIKPAFCICENKAATMQLISAFGFLHTYR